MRIAIVSDIHSNLEAFTKALELIKNKKVDNIICLGDIVGYGANPKDCLELAFANCSNIIMGNHDQAATNLAFTDYFNPYARAAAEWTHRILSQTEQGKIKNLPITHEFNGFQFLHSTPFEPSEWHYIVSYEDASLNFKHSTKNICFVGHSHIAEIYPEDYSEYRTHNSSKSFRLKPDKKYIINVGSVGQPRDRDSRLSFGIIDTETLNYENIRSEYDVESAVKKIIEAKLPRYLADRLIIGR